VGGKARHRVMTSVASQSTAPPRANNAFVRHAIDTLNKHDGRRNALFVRVVTEFLFQQGLLHYDEERRLVWVCHPDRGWIVAIWIIEAEG
jgi:hypothetical protein